MVGKDVLFITIILLLVPYLLTYYFIYPEVKKYFYSLRGVSAITVCRIVGICMNMMTSCCLNYDLKRYLRCIESVVHNKQQISFSSSPPNFRSTLKSSGANSIE